MTKGLGLMGFSTQLNPNSKGLEFFFKWIWIHFFNSFRVWEGFGFYILDTLTAGMRPEIFIWEAKLRY